MLKHGIFQYTCSVQQQQIGLIKFVYDWIHCWMKIPESIMLKIRKNRRRSERERDKLRFVSFPLSV